MDLLEVVRGLLHACTKASSRKGSQIAQNATVPAASFFRPRQGQDFFAEGSLHFSELPDYSGSGLSELWVHTPEGDVRTWCQTLELLERSLEEIVCLHGMRNARWLVSEMLANSLFDEGQDLSDTQQELDEAFQLRAQERLARLRALRLQWGMAPAEALSPLSSGKAHI